MLNFFCIFLFISKVHKKYLHPNWFKWEADYKWKPLDALFPQSMYSLSGSMGHIHTRGHMTQMWIWKFCFTSYIEWFRCWRQKSNLHDFKNALKSFHLFPPYENTVTKIRIENQHNMEVYIWCFCIWEFIRRTCVVF